MLYFFLVDNTVCKRQISHYNYYNSCAVPNYSRHISRTWLPDQVLRTGKAKVVLEYGRILGRDPAPSPFSLTILEIFYESNIIKTAFWTQIRFPKFPVLSSPFSTFLEFPLLKLECTSTLSFSRLRYHNVCNVQHSWRKDPRQVWVRTQNNNCKPKMNFTCIKIS